jgi:hypothetical protein
MADFEVDVALQLEKASNKEAKDEWNGWMDESDDDGDSFIDAIMVRTRTSPTESRQVRQGKWRQGTMPSLLCPIQ